MWFLSSGCDCSTVMTVKTLVGKKHLSAAITATLFFCFISSFKAEHQSCHGAYDLYFVLDRYVLSKFSVPFPCFMQVLNIKRIVILSSLVDTAATFIRWCIVQKIYKIVFVVVSIFRRHELPFVSSSAVWPDFTSCRHYWQTAANWKTQAWIQWKVFL